MVCPVYKLPAAIVRVSEEELDLSVMVDGGIVCGTFLVLNLKKSV